jgi:hypothetical protein
VQEVICRVKAQGYFVLKLDSAGFMTDAHALYRSVGFLDTAPYEGSDIPPESQKHSVFMRFRLDQGLGDADH